MFWQLILLGVASAIGSPPPRARVADLGQKAGAWWTLGIITVAAAVFSRGIAVVLASGIIAATLVGVYRSGRRRKARIAAAKSTATILGSVVGELSAGASMGQAMQDATEHVPSGTPNDISRVIAASARRAQSGASGAQLLIDAPDTCQDLQQVGLLWRAAERRGIALAGLLGQSARRIDAQLRHQAATRASLQGPQATAVVLSLLPLAGIGMGQAMGARPIAFLVGSPLGNVLLVVGTALACAGFVWVQLMLDKAGGLR